MTRKYFRLIFSIKTRNPGKLLSCNYCYTIYEEYVPNNYQSLYLELEAAYRAATAAADATHVDANFA